MTLLSIVQDAAVLLGLPEPTAVAASTDPATKKLMRLANMAGKELTGYHDWQGLIVEVDFAALATQEQTNALPPNDYDRLIYNAVIWDTTAHLKLMGPTPQRYWRDIKAGISSGVSGYWRIIGGQLNVLPVMTAGNVLSFEYISKRWVLSSLGVEQDVFMSDTDTCKVPVFENLLTLEIVWRFQQSRGFGQYAEALETCEREKEKAASTDRATGRIRKERSYRDGEAPPSPYFAGLVGV